MMGSIRLGRLGKVGQIVGALATLYCAGCGYHFTSSGAGLPSQAKTLYVEKFSNHTRYTGINDELMRYLKDEIANRKRLDLVDSPDDADLVLKGEVYTIETRPLASNAVGEPIVYTEAIKVTAMLSDNRAHKVIWSSKNIGTTQNAPSVASAVVTTSPIFLQQNLRAQDIGNLPDIQLAQTQRAATRQYSMEQLAQNLYVSMSEGF
jgi:lipopolysaccharide assembly LptE-like protein